MQFKLERHLFSNFDENPSLTIAAKVHIIFFPRGASIQFDEKPANVIVNSADASESDSKEDEEDEKEPANSEE